MASPYTDGCSSEDEALEAIADPRLSKIQWHAAVLSSGAARLNPTSIGKKRPSKLSSDYSRANPA